MHEINCDDMDQFVLIITRLVEAGFSFKADAGTFTITLTGGF